MLFTNNLNNTTAYDSKLQPFLLVAPSERVRMDDSYYHKLADRFTAFQSHEAVKIIILSTTSLKTAFR